MKTKVLVISCVVVLLLVGCGEAAPPAPTSTLPPSPPNPHAEDAFKAFCKATEEGNLENALELVTEDFMLIDMNVGDDPSETEYKGSIGLEYFIDDYAETLNRECRVQRFVFNGDEVEFWWIDTYPYGGQYKVTVSCEGNGTMQGDKIHRIVKKCIGEYE